MFHPFSYLKLSAFRKPPVPRHHPHHPDTSPLPPRHAPPYPPPMQHQRNADAPIAITISFVADTSAAMPRSGSHANTERLLLLGKNIIGIVATLCHTPYESITKTTSPQLRRSVKQPPAAITTSFVANAFRGQDVVRIGQRQGGLVSPICKNTSPRSYGSAKNECPSALGYNGQQKPLKGRREGQEGARVQRVAKALKGPGEGREHARLQR